MTSLIIYQFFGFVGKTHKKVDGAPTCCEYRKWTEDAIAHIVQDMQCTNWAPVETSTLNYALDYFTNVLKSIIDVHVPLK